MSREHVPSSATGRMVRLRTVTSPFHARVLVARLGADGIVTELRGNVGGPYPVGETSVWVPEEEAEVARALLLADEVEATFLGLDDGEPAPAGPPAAGGRDARRVWVRRTVAGAGLVALALAAVATHAGF